MARDRRITASRLMEPTTTKATLRRLESILRPTQSRNSRFKRVWLRQKVVVPAVASFLRQRALEARSITVVLMSFIKDVLRALSAGQINEIRPIFRIEIRINSAEQLAAASSCHASAKAG